MLTIGLSIIIILAAAVLNRVRGGGFYGDKLPGRALFYVAPVIGLLALALHSQLIAVTVFLGYFLWAAFSWGATLGRIGGFTPDRKIDGLEELLSKLPPSVAVFVRMMFVLPMVAVIAFILGNPWFLLAAPIFAGLSVIVYRILFRPISDYDWMRSEIAVGGLWGLLIVSILLF